MVNYSSRTIGFCVKIVYLVDIFDTGPDPPKTEKFVTQPVPTHGWTRPMSSCALYRVNIDPCPAVRYTGLTYFENVGRGTYTI